MTGHLTPEHRRKISASLRRHYSFALGAPSARRAGAKQKQRAGQPEGPGGPGAPTRPGLR